MKILIVSDAWHPQVNGVVRTLAMTEAELTQMGHRVDILGPDRFRTVPLPSYPEIRIAVDAEWRMRRLLRDANPDALHIATEGPLGLAARNHCVRRGIGFTTAYHTRFPEYVRDRAPVPVALTYRLLRWFHAPAKSVMVATPSIESDLVARGFRNVRRWSRGVDTTLFRPRPELADGAFPDLPRPISLYVGRVAVEKNIEAFLSLDLPGTKLVVGGGPALAQLRTKYPEVRFAGPLLGEDLARAYAGADVFVFPSRTDTFGLVLLEAMASGLPVAAFPVAGPLDVVGSSGAGVLSEDLGAAVLEALAIPRGRARAHALRFSWRAAAQQFLDNLQPLPPEALAA